MERDQDAKERLAAYLKELHLPAFRSSYEELARQAQQEGLSFEQYLLGLAQRECQERRHKRIEQRTCPLLLPAESQPRGPGRARDAQGRKRRSTRL